MTWKNAEIPIPLAIALLTIARYTLDLATFVQTAIKYRNIRRSWRTMKEVDRAMGQHLLDTWERLQ